MADPNSPLSMPSPPASGVAGLATATARTMMVDSQVRPNKVVDARIIAAMRRLPREAFLPESLAARAYSDEDVSLGGGRVMPEPMVIARMVQAAGLHRGERVLVVACGAGYGAALIAACGVHVTALEEDPALLAIARMALAAHAPEVDLVEGSLVAGWKDAAPYDCVFIEGAVEELPAAIAEQVNRTGRLVMVRSQGGHVTQAVTGRMGSAGLSFHPEFDCAVPTLPAMRRKPVFVF